MQDEKKNPKSQLFPKIGAARPLASWEENLSSSILMSILESTADGVLVVSSEGTWTIFNQKFVNMWGIPASICESRNDQVAINHVLAKLTDPQAFTSKIQELYHDDEQESLDIIELKDGRVFQRYSTPQRLGEKIIGRVWSFRDITARLNAQQALGKERILLQTLMENTPDHIYFKDIQSRFIRMSNSQAKRFNLSDPEQAVGKTDFDFFSKSHAQRAFDAEQLIINTNQPLIGIEEKETWVDLPDTWVFSTKLPMHDENGMVTGTMGISRDITERKLAELALAESDSLKELLLDIITHDLKNPASVIHSLAEMGRLEYPENEIIQNIFASSGRLLEVLENTTILSQATQGEAIPRAPLNLCDLIMGIADDFSSALQVAGMELETFRTPGVIIHANPLIGEVLKNYISNAIKYAAHGKKIIITCEASESEILISVKDFGHTIPVEDRQRIFQRQTQLSNGKNKGRGLGLAIVKRIAAAHGGEVWVEPNETVGNAFYLRLPREEDPPSL